MKKDVLLSVDGWDIKPFFLKIYMEENEAFENKMELFWSMTNKILMAKEIEKENSIKVDDKDIEKEINELLKVKDIQEALDKEITIDDLKLFVKIDILSAIVMNNVTESIQENIRENPQIVEEIYNKQDNLFIKNAYEIYEVWGKNTIDTKKKYSLEELNLMGFQNRGLGVFGESEISLLFPEDIKIVGSDVGSVLEVDLKGEEKLYYFIAEKYDKYRKKYEEVKEEFENFIFNYLLDESLNNIYDRLYDKYKIEYNEDLLEKLLGE